MVAGAVAWGSDRRLSFAKIRSTRDLWRFVGSRSVAGTDRSARVLLITVLAAARSALRTRGARALENLALRQQLAVLQRRRPRPPLDWLFWVALSGAWSRWRDVLIIVKPDICSDGRGTSTSPTLRSYSRASTNGFAIACARCNSNSGNVARRSFANYPPEESRSTWPPWPPDSRATGGESPRTRHSKSPSPSATTTRKVCRDLPRNLTLPNRPVRTRMPGGVGGK